MAYEGQNNRSYGFQAPPYPTQVGQHPAYPPSSQYSGQPQPYYGNQQNVYGNYPQQPPPQPVNNSHYSEPDQGRTTDYEAGSSLAFDSTSIRNGFIRKVYCILMVQLTITVGVILLLLYHEATKEFVQDHIELWFVALVAMLVSMIALACCGDLRRKFPINFILLFVFTLAEAFFLGVTASYYDSDEVLMAVGITAAVCLGLTLFALQTKWDFTVMRGMMVVFLVVLLLFGFITIFVHNRIMSLVYAALGAFIFAAYLVIDTQMLLGGKHKYSISPEEYIFAALALYVDIINIFTYLLAIIGLVSD